MNYWLVVTSYENFSLDRDQLGFRMQGLPYRSRKSVKEMSNGDRVVYYVMGRQKLGATATITGDYVEDSTKLWFEEEERWPARRPSRPDIVLQDDELVDAKKLVPDLTFVERKEHWGVHFQGSIRHIPEEDFHLIESEMREALAERGSMPTAYLPSQSRPLSEAEYESAIMALPLVTKSLHDRLGEMLETIGSKMDYNAQTRHRITADHSYQLDVAWLRKLRNRNPEVAIEVQIEGNLTEAKDRLAHARKFNYRKVVLVLREADLARLNSLMRYEHDLRNWMEPWSIGAVYEMYTAGERFFRYYRQLIEAVYKDKKELELVE